MKYDPRRNPNPLTWLSLTQFERVEIVSAYHVAKKVDLPNPLLHAVIHTIIENQVAQGDELPVKATLIRLVLEGLDRHEAVHAIGSVLATEIHGILTDPAAWPKPTQQYLDAVSALTVSSWLQSFHH